MNPTRNEIIFATGFYTGFSPIAPGTVGSFLAFLIYLIPGFENLYFLIPVIIITFFYGVRICNRMEYILGDDPSECTIDEFVGTWIAFMTLPKTMPVLIIAFVIWRILDILKPPPANVFENFTHGWGVMLDDVMSGFYTMVLMRFLIYFEIIPLR